MRVLELSTLFPGPLAGRLLLQLGFEVVKVEPPGGDPPTPNLAHSLQGA